MCLDVICLGKAQPLESPIPISECYKLSFIPQMQGKAEHQSNNQINRNHKLPAPFPIILLFQCNHGLQKWQMHQIKGIRHLREPINRLIEFAQGLDLIKPRNGASNENRNEREVRHLVEKLTLVAETPRQMVAN